MKLTIISFFFICSFATIPACAQNQNKAEDTDAKASTDFQVGGLDSQRMKQMYTFTMQSVIEGQLEYYETSDVIERIAKLNKKYHEALVKAGFTEEQALKIITDAPLIPSSGSSNH